MVRQFTLANYHNNNWLAAVMIDILYESQSTCRNVKSGLIIPRVDNG